MFEPLDVLDKALQNRTRVYNKALHAKLATYGKQCTYYIIDKMESSENSSQQVDSLDSENRENNYTLAFGADNVGFDYSKLHTENGYIYADYAEFFKHDIGAEESPIFYLQVENIKVSRGDVISYTVMHKQVFYRISEIIQSYHDIVYRIQTKLIQVKFENRQIPFSEINDNKAQFNVLPENGILL